jgi:hypothetical protein
MGRGFCGGESDCKGESPLAGVARAVELGDVGASVRERSSIGNGGREETPVESTGLLEPLGIGILPLLVLENGAIPATPARSAVRTDVP